MKSNGLKYIFLGLIAAALLCFVMGGVTIRREIQLLSQRPPATKSSSPGRRTPPVASQRDPAPPPQAPISNPATTELRNGYVLSPGLPTRGQLSGKFEGKTILESRGVLCGDSMVLHSDAAQNGQVVAFETLQRIDPMAMYSAPKGRAAIRGLVMGIAGQTLPVNYVLTGERQAGGVVQLKVLPAAGKHDKCVMTTGTLTPFGYDQILFQWEEGACGKADMMLTQVEM